MELPNETHKIGLGVIYTDMRRFPSSSDSNYQIVDRQLEMYIGGLL